MHRIEPWQGGAETRCVCLQARLAAEGNQAGEIEGQPLAQASGEAARPLPSKPCTAPSTPAPSTQVRRPLQPHAAEPDSREVCCSEAEPGMLDTRRAWWPLRQTEQANVPCRHALATVSPEAERDALFVQIEE